MAGLSRFLLVRTAISAAALHKDAETGANHRKICLTFKPPVWQVSYCKFVKHIVKIAVLIGLTLLSGCQRTHPALAKLPARMVWAWERKEDLRWLPTGVGVAFVATTVELSGADSHATARANPLLVRPDTRLLPVVHVDASWRLPPELNAAQKEMVVTQVLRAAQASGGYPVVQLDFEVRRSQRAFLQEVVTEIRKRLPRETALSITALASWCLGDYWLNQMPADEIVPMTFRMGFDQQAIRNQLFQHRQFAWPNCKNAIGYASDEPIFPTTASRSYYFSPQAWTAANWQRISNANQEKDAFHE